MSDEDYDVVDTYKGAETTLHYDTEGEQHAVLHAKTYPVYKGYNVVEDYHIAKQFLPAVSSSRLYGTIGPKIEKGLTINEVLELMPRFLFEREPLTVGRDDDGLVVEWHYPGVIITFAYAPDQRDPQYCVQQIQVKDD